MDRFSVQCLKLNSFSRKSDGSNYFRNQIGRSMRYSDTKSDSRAHRGFTFFNARYNRIPVLGLNLAIGYKTANQFVNGLPPVFGLQVNDDGIRTKKVIQIGIMHLTNALKV